MQISNLQSPSSGRPVPNQFLITTDKGEFFKSYESMIGYIGRDGGKKVTEALDYSPTTAKYTAVFFDEPAWMVRKAVERGEIEMVTEGELEDLLEEQWTR